MTSEPRASTDSAPPVTATYRLQLHAGFTTADAAAQVPYLADLGVSHLYLSPVLTSQPGSTHGYDVVDHTRVDPEIGGREGLERLVAAAREHGLGVVVDVVPNHMALPEQAWRNAPLWAYLREGPDSPSAAWFDVDLHHLDGRIGLPVLGASPSEVRADLHLDVGRDDEGPAAGQPVLRYFDRVLPLRPDAATDGDVLEVLQAQHYRLTSWRERDTVLNYRRFFEVDSLIAIRVEDETVFEASHRLLLDLHHAGLVDGFRIDHPDGLADPEGYLRRLADACRPGTPIWVEKILIGAERLPDSWPVAGTTGYDGLLAISTALTPRSERAVRTVDAAWRHAKGDPSIEPVIARSQEHAVDRLLRPEVDRLAREVAAATGVPTDRARDAVRSRLLRTTVYREYGADADLGEIGALPGADALGPGVAARLQQTTGPVMAKGVEDTAFYRWNRLTALNEVGGEPDDGRAPGEAHLHAWAAHQQDRWPGGLVALTTHDTKRSADVRARLLTLAGDPEAWKELSGWALWRAWENDVDLPTAHLVWQAIAGLGGEQLDDDEDRLEDFCLKAIREAKEHTAWVDGDPEYEERIRAFALTMLREPSFRRILSEAVVRNKTALHAQVLGAAALQLTLPGVPDVYQGCEGLRLALVDPDNRRPVDFAELAEDVEQIQAFTSGAGAAVPQGLDARKLLLTRQVLRWRREHPDAVGADVGYTPLALGDAGVGFLRGDRLATLVRFVGPDAPDPAATTVALPAGEWVDVVTGARHTLSGSPARLGDLTADLPVAVLHRPRATDTTRGGTP